MSTWQSYFKANLASTPEFQHKAGVAGRKIGKLIGPLPRGLKERQCRAGGITCTTALRHDAPSSLERRSRSI